MASGSGVEPLEPKGYAAPAGTAYAAWLGRGLDARPARTMGTRPEGGRDLTGG